MNQPPRRRRNSSHRFGIATEAVILRILDQARSYRVEINISGHGLQRIAPALAAGHWVLSDRFSGSTAAYQGYGRGLSLALIEQLERIATADLQPDLTVWLDLPLAESQRRRGERPADRIEAAGEAFLGRVCGGFAALAAQRGWSRFDARLAPEQVSEAIGALLAQRFGPRADLHG